MPRHSSPFCHERPHQENETAGGGGRGQSGTNLEAGSSVHDAGQSSRINDGRYNRISITDLLCDDDQHDDSEEHVCKINNCNRKFFSERSLRTHQGRTHQPITDRVCAVCSANFARQAELIKHVRCSQS